jgi:hypothetical protein
MGHKERRAYLEAIRKRYAKADKSSKTAILDEFCEVCGYNRKYAIRLLNKSHEAKPKKRGRKSQYQHPPFIKILTHFWKTTDFICSIRFIALLPEWIPHYEQSFGPIPEDIRRLLLSISRATLDRVLKPLRGRFKKGLSGTKPGSLLRNQIPIRTSNWDIRRPGFMESDTVAHCGNSLAGEFVWSLLMTDILTTWTECRAVWNKDANDVVAKVQEIERELPFPLLGFDSDNGSEFINYALYRHFAHRPTPVCFTRSRPYKKNDNAHVEQKNWAQARHLLGYDRIDNRQALSLINDLYANEWSLYQNHFCPSVKLTSKFRIGSRYRKVYDTPRTPYQRVLESPEIAQSIKERLKAEHQRLNPFELKNAIVRKQKAIFALVRVTSILSRRI